MDRCGERSKPARGRDHYAEWVVRPEGLIEDIEVTLGIAIAGLSKADLGVRFS